MSKDSIFYEHATWRMKMRLLEWVLYLTKCGCINWKSCGLYHAAEITFLWKPIDLYLSGDYFSSNALGVSIYPRKSKNKQTRENLKTILHDIYTVITYNTLCDFFDETYDYAWGEDVN
jgi:hypothetical protein